MIDILYDPEVIKVAKEMGLDVVGKGSLCPQTVYGCLTSVAFAMRDKMETEDLMWHWILNINDLCSEAVELDDRHMHSLRYSTPEQWIRAACAAWEAKS